MPVPAEDRKYFESALVELEDYLLSDVLYYPMIAPMPSLTIGGLLLAQRRLQAVSDVSPLNLRLDTLRTKWRVAWEKKATREMGARLTLWRNYLIDYDENDRVGVYYAHEVRLRAMLALLATELGEPLDELDALDRVLRTNFSSGDFVWDEEFTSQFPRDEFWFLYGKLK